MLNIVVIDITNLDIADQMYLYYELSRFIKDLPAGQSLAICWQSEESHLTLQNFTSDHGLLLAAIRRAIPRFPPPDRGYFIDSDLVTLKMIADDFAQYPGRKNVLWFSGGSSSFSLSVDPRSGLTAFPDPDRLRGIYDALESHRIAIYPVDARGLQVVGWFQALTIASQQASMRGVADATGGTAFYNNNGLDKIAARWVDNGGSFYTITYSPNDFRLDSEWHNVTVKLSPEFKGYTLSYRRGYFADGSPGVPQEKHESRAILLAGGDTLKVPDERGIPIVFQVRVEPASAEPASSTRAADSPNVQALKKGTTPYLIEYSLPAAEFAPKIVDGKSDFDIGVSVFAFNDEGSVESRLADRVTIVVDENALRQHPKGVLRVDQQINLHKGQKYLYLAAWDKTTGRLGTLQVPLKVVPEPKQPPAR